MNGVCSSHLFGPSQRCPGAQQGASSCKFLFQFNRIFSWVFFLGGGLVLVIFLLP